jgi:predicted metal-dependent TIM-barrel fold hydrolase
MPNATTSKITIGIHTPISVKKADVTTPIIMLRRKKAQMKRMIIVAMMSLGTAQTILARSIVQSLTKYRKPNIVRMPSPASVMRQR